MAQHSFTQGNPILAAHALAISEATYAQRGFDFAYAALLFDDPHRIEWLHGRVDYGESRWQTIGAIDGRGFFVACTLRGARLRIISARRAHEIGSVTVAQSRSERGWMPA